MEPENDPECVSDFRRRLAPALVTVIQCLLLPMGNGFTYGKWFHLLMEIVSKLLRTLTKVFSDANLFSQTCETWLLLTCSVSSI